MTMKKWMALLIGLVTLVLTVPGYGEEEPNIEMITRKPTALPASGVSRPEITVDGVMDRQFGVNLVAGEIIVVSWYAEGEVQFYHVSITGEDDREIRTFDTTDGMGIIRASELAEGEAFTLTVTAIPVGGTLEDGISASTRVASYMATPEPTPNPTPTPEPVLQTGEISDSWEDIVAAVEDGSARQRYAVGATKALELEGMGVVHMQLAGFDLDTRSDGQGKAATTWIAVELLPKGHVMNEKDTIEGGWRDSALRAYLQDDVLPAMPAIVRERIVSVEKHQRLTAGKSQVTNDEVWIPDYNEMFGEDALYYELFQDSRKKRVKTRNGTSSWWWLRSAYSYNSYDVYVVRANGYTYNNRANYSGGVALGFCL